MKEVELLGVANCAICKKPFGHTQLPLFWRVRLQRLGVDLRAMQRRDGLAALLGGNSELARVMGPDEDMALLIAEAEITVCEECAWEVSRPIGLLMPEEENEDGAEEEGTEG